MLQVERIESKFLGEISDEKNGFCIRMLPEGNPKKNNGNYSLPVRTNYCD